MAIVFEDSPGDLTDGDSIKESGADNLGQLYFSLIGSFSLSCNFDALEPFEDLALDLETH